MDEDTYEIIYDNGVPVIAFQICDDTETTKEEDSNDPQVAGAVDDNETLQYFREDESVPHSKTQKKVKTPKQKPEKQERVVEKERDKLDFVIVHCNNKNNSKKLYDSLGYSYTLRNVSVREGMSIWRCRYKMKNHVRKECGAKMSITMDEQATLLQRHIHPPDRTIDFGHLQQTRMAPDRPFPFHRKQSQSKAASKSYQISQDRPKESKSQQETNNRDSKECDKMLDYFSEGNELGTAEEIQLVHEREVTDSFWAEEPTVQDSKAGPKVLKTAPENSKASPKVLKSAPEDSKAGPKVLKTAPEDSKAVSEDLKAGSEDKPVQFQVVDNGNLTGTQILYDSLGYSYSIEKKGATTRWSCQASSSSDGTPCKVKVVQDGSQQFNCLGSHSHSPKRHTLLKISKMQIFSPENRVNMESFQSKSPKKIVTPRKDKRERKKSSSSEDEDEDHMGLTVKKIRKENNNEESFQFNTREISFTVSLESDDEKSMKQVTRRSASPVSKLIEIGRLALSPSHNVSNNDVQYHAECSPVLGASMLFDSRGHMYTVSDTLTGREVRTSWLCSYPVENCHAKVIHFMNNFTRVGDHSHPPNLRKFLQHLVQLEAVEVLKDPKSIRQSGIDIVKGILKKYVDIPFNLDNKFLTRWINQYRKNPQGPPNVKETSSFSKKKIPKHFLLDQLMTESKFHLTFASALQLAYLSAAMEWYVDEADLDLPPFTNLFSIHVYTQHEEQPRQIPVFFALISDRRENDYSQLFTSLKSALSTPPSVSSIIIDLNIPLRKSIFKNFIDVEIKCCDLHWSEDIANKLKEMDLSTFIGDYRAMNYLSQIPLLNLLPRQDFETALSKIEDNIVDDSVQDLICYVRETFGERSLWAPRYWSSFKMPVRVTNHEFWRRDLINDNTSSTDVNGFIQNLYLKSKSVGDNLRLMPKKKIKKYYLTRPETTLCKVYHLWKSYCKDDFNCHTLLNKLASIIHSL